ncbi:type VI secretion protein [Streptomyces sp. NPDC052051]|uniref:type IV secretory system conjugative DNA transfer family protein n=1 Tax=Streptomyces sp. NPDC052051 TaxID=3154649 RepID=UPI0034362F94
MRPGRERQKQEGIPDGLLVGMLTFLLGVTLMVWTATGIAGWFARGAWPRGVRFSRTPMAIRQLLAQPHDLAGAWPDTPADQLSGYGLFWGLFISELMVLVVLSVFAIGTVTRWRALRAHRRTAGPGPERGHGAPEQRPTAPSSTQEVPETREAAPVTREIPVTEHVPTPRPAAEPTEAPAVPAPLTVAQAALSADEPQTVQAAAQPPPATARTGSVQTAPSVILGAPDVRHPIAAQALREAEGPALVVTSSPALWSETKDARAKLGPVLLYDPSHLCETPARLHWAPTAGCEDKATAAARAVALLAPVRPTARIDEALADVAETLLRSYLHAAAIDGRTIRHLHRWAQGTQIQEAVRALRTNPKASSGTAGELEAALTSHPERRDMAQELTGRALASLSTVNIREACTPHRTDSLALDSFVNEGGTLYVVGEPIEDPRQRPGAMPLLTALASSVVERGRRMAERSSSGRLDPPLTLVLDDVAAVAPLPQLPELLSTGADRGLPTLALLRSREQARTRWPHHELPV